ncbi:hypothetical protein RND81_14G139900 [Saponaria officinalis]|uniref:Uncharacterized protein n=1 Tax=Saponaria officinalis TaxID=3572 RepID=A0AAW1GQL3_SAPOF
MEERQLNFYQPLLSVRRGSSMAAQPKVNPKKTNDSKPTLPSLPFYKSDLKSGPVRNPGVVPFQWEQMPGRPKDEKIVPKDNTWQRDVAPKLPPGRIVNHKQNSMDSTPKDSPHSTGSQTGNTILSGCENTENDPQDNDIPSSDDDNVTFVDARDTLSRTESFFNCSVSGVSGLDNQITECSGIYADPQTRDFMMGRFLPAAKAVASETPHFVPRKHSAAKEQLMPVKRVIKWKQRSPDSTQYTLPHHVDENEEDEDEYVEMEDVSAKLCGLLPKFCLLNPIPGMRDHTKAISSVRSVRTRPAYTEFCCKNEKKDRTNSNRGEMKRVPHQYASKNEPSINRSFGFQSTAPIKDGSPQSFLDKEKSLLGLPQECRDLKGGKYGVKNHGAAKINEVISLQDARETTGSSNPAIEKTLYVDSEPMEQSRNSVSSSSESRGRNPSVDSLQDIKCINNGDEKQLNYPLSSETVDYSVVSTPEKSFQHVGEDLPRDQESNRDVKEDVHDNELLGLGPIMPKSPSESWLSRTLPSMLTKNLSPKPYLGNMAFRSSPVDPRRERRLRTSNFQHMVFRPGGELGPILEN